MPKHIKPWKKDRMIRHTHFLKEKEVAILNSIADKTGVSVSELLRNAIDDMYLKG